MKDAHEPSILEGIHLVHEEQGCEYNASSVQVGAAHQGVSSGPGP
jgi:hypothetical protein